MTERAVEVCAYSGYLRDESPRAFILDGKRIEVRMIMDQWIEEDAETRARRRCFRVKGDDSRTHFICCLEVEGRWLHRVEAEHG
jgi:hypothetical protein